MADPIPQQSGNNAGHELQQAHVVLYQPMPLARRCSGTKSEANALPTERNIPHTLHKRQTAPQSK